MLRFFLSLLVLSGLGPSLDAARQPNVVVILADDLGWSDTTLYGTTKYYQTPNIERLAKLELYSKDSWLAVLRDGKQLPVSRTGHARLKELIG